MALIPAVAALLSLAIGSLAALRGWQGWLELRREQLLSRAGEPPLADLSDLRRRVRSLEAIASGTD